MSESIQPVPDPLWILRGEAESAARGRPVRPLPLLGWALTGTVLFGATVGSYSHDGMQVLASGVKLPVLLGLTGLLCFPSFHVIQGLRATAPLGLQQSAAMLARSLVTTAVVWGTLAPPLFVLVTTLQHYALAKTFTVVVAAIGGLAGVGRLAADYRGRCEPESGRIPVALLAYFAVFGVCGAQIAWVLRPFVGSPSEPFSWFRSLQGNVATDLLRMLGG